MKYLFGLTAVPLLLLMTALPGQAQNQYPDGYYGQQQNWRGVLSAEDQQKFDKYYSKWEDASRKNDQDDIRENAQHMSDIMTRNNIPTSVPFAQIASNPGPAYGPQGAYPANGYPNPNYPGDPNNGGYQNGYPAYGQTHFSPDDQRKFDKDYEKWVDAQRKNDRDDIDKNARDMEQIMARYNVPPNVPFQILATNGYATAPNGASPYPYGFGQSAQRLSSKDQSDFDKAYKHWVDARRKKDMDDVDKNARKMQEIMARYNIPANVPFDQIASNGAYR